MDEDQQLHLDLPGVGNAAGERLSADVRAVAAAVAELVESLGDEAELSALAVDWRAAGLAAAFRLAMEDRSLVGGLGLPDPPAGGPGAEADLSPEEIVEGLVALIGDGDELGVVLRSLATHGGPFRGAATDRLEALGRSIGPAPAPTVAAARRLATIPGDEDELILELAYPDDPAGGGEDAILRSGIAVLLDTFGGRRPIDVLLLDDLDEYLDEVTSGAPSTRVEELPVADAISLLAFALWLFDHTLGAAAELPEDSDLLLVRPLLDRLVATHPHDDYDRPEVDDATRDEAIGAFTRWAAAGGADIDDAFVPLLVDFAADQADDPLRWSARVAVEFLQMACHKVLAPPEELEALPDLVRLMIRWAHGQNGWPADVTADTLAVIDQVEPLFEAELDALRHFGSGRAAAGPTGDRPGGPDASGHLAEVVPLGLPGLPSPSVEESDLVVPPEGGHHPEPFDDRRVPEELRGKVGLIVAEATDRAVELFDAEFATLTRRLIADAAGRQASPLGRGKPTIWASGAIYAVAQLNEIPGGWSPLARPAGEITSALDGAPNTIASKARALRDLLDADRFPPEPRYQHSTSVAATGDLLSSVLGLVGGFEPEGVPGERGGLRLVPPPPTPAPGSVDPASAGADCFVLRVGLADIRPEIWRRVRMPVDATFAQLHELLQLVFGWGGYHLHLFDLDTCTVGPTGGDLGFHDPDSIDERKLRLCDAIGPGSELVYLYDFGDNWEHRAVVEEAEDLGARKDIATGEPMGPFALLGGANAGPPEDCGGWIGYRDILQSLRNRNHPRRAELAEWLPAGFDPKRFDAYTLNQAVHQRFPG